MVCTCKYCGGNVEWALGDATGVCKDCGAEQAIEARDLYEQACLLAKEDTEEGLEEALLLFRSTRGWQDADAQYASCRTRLARLRWQAESAMLKEQEDRFEAKVARWKKIALTVLAAVLLCFAVVTAFTLIRFKQYSKAKELYTAGEYAPAAVAFREMADYKDARAMVYLSAVELYKTGRYAEAIPYFEWLGGSFDNGYHLQKCQERLAAQEAAAPGP
ncbi:MAG: tetratricopeptide repeat protein [Oscillospiraceae bacterium]|nr:tetratricopeptide repeat protein [Oscillospiraceae bacterium]